MKTDIKKVWFTSDLHFKHEKILQLHDKRRLVLGDSIEKHDENLIKLWNSTVSKYDTIYIIGDITLTQIENQRKLFSRLNGNKILIQGNHDKISDSNRNFFCEIKTIKKMKFKKSVYPFLSEDMQVIMCHFPLLAWEGRDSGSVMVHGHCHGKTDELNTASKELRVDVGLDSALGDYSFVSLEKLYAHFKNITKGKTFKEYNKDLTV